MTYGLTLKGIEKINVLVLVLIFLKMTLNLYIFYMFINDGK